MLCTHIVHVHVHTQEVPICKKCRGKKRREKGGDDEETPGVMKPDIVFFGEGLPDEFHHTLEEDKTKVRLLIEVSVGSYNYMYLSCRLTF